MGLGGQRRSAAQLPDDWTWRLLPGPGRSTPQGASQYASNTPRRASSAKQGGSVFGIVNVNDGGFTGTAAAPGIYELTTAWSVFASYEHFWTPSLRTSLYGSYVDYSRSDALNTAMCASGLQTGGTSALGRAGGCDLDSQYWVVGSRSQWNITKDLYMGFDVLYSKAEQRQHSTRLGPIPPPRVTA